VSLAPGRIRFVAGHGSMFESITSGLGNALSFFRGKKLTEQNIREGIELVQQALLEADVEFDVAKQFTNRVAEKVIGQQIFKSLDPTQQFVGIVFQELVGLMGPVDHSLPLKKDKLCVIMMVGLQGSGKTTTCGKLAKMLQGQGWKPMLVAADLQRPAAIDQLKVIGGQLGVPVYSEQQPTNAVKVCTNGVAAAKKAADVNVVILDTAGRLHVDAELMHELEQIDRRVMPNQVFLVCDAMTGQDAVKSAKAFNDSLELDGVILTKLDGDARGGAALSVKSVTGVPVKYVGLGEQLDKLELFHPDRMAGRILGQGDVLTLFEKAQQQFDAEEVARQQEKMKAGRFTLTDFREQMKMVKKLGSVRGLMEMIPGLSQLMRMLPDDPDKEMGRVEAMINSMTPAERDNPKLIDHSRRRRIARGSGVEPADVNQLLKDFSSMSVMMQEMGQMSKLEQLRQISQIAKGGMLNPGAGLQLARKPTRQPPADLDKLRDKKKQQRKEAKKQRKKNRR
jgi:signal recognition particle subunit SRP54